jgi:hypothetical protein
MSGHALERIRFSPNVAAEVRAAIEPHLVKWAFLIPAWCREVCVRWDDEDPDSACRIRARYEYREADLYVCAVFLSEPEERERIVVHELSHLTLAPFVSVLHAMRDVLVAKAPDVEAWADEMLRLGEEASTCDLTALVMERLA